MPSLVGVANESAEAPSKETVDYINPMIGAITLGGYGGHGLGKTFPGPTTPLGMVQLSPDTITGGDNGPGYSSHHETIEGFSFTHMSGIGWYGELGNFQVMPTTGPRQLNRDLAKSAYSHDRETAKAGYYSVMLDRYNIQVELTAAPRSGMIRMTFPESGNSRIQIDLARRIGQKERWLSHGKQHVEVVDDHTIQGYMYCPREDGGWGHGDGNVTYTEYFYAQLSKPIEQFGVFDKDTVFESKRSYDGSNTGFFIDFVTEKDEPVLLKTGVSYVSIDGAKENLTHDIPGWDFDKVYHDARSLWADALAGVAIEGGSDKEKEIFATALYHCFIDPRSISDIDGFYIGADNEKHQADGFIYRSIFSGWDVFRSQFPLLTIIRPDVVNDEINSLLQMGILSKREYLPRWELLNSYSGCMLGNPAVSVIADAYHKGIRNYDIDEAYKQCVNSVEKFSNFEEDRGFTPDMISHTLEYAYTDWCVGRMAETLGKTADAKKYNQRAQAYHNIWDPKVKWFRAKKANGDWTEWKGKEVHWQGTIESNPYQQGWFVPHDVAGMIELMGPEFFEQELEAFFDKVPDDFLWNDFYNHPNEPCHHVAFLFNYIGKPWLTQKWTRTICDRAYGTGVRGLCGNEDVGQMSAWYVFTAMGLHPVCPGDNMYQLTSPVFDKVSIRLDPSYYKGGTFHVIAHDNSPENIYIQSAKLNGQPLNRPWIMHDEIAAGGTLEFQMGKNPNKAWGAGDIPPTSASD
ncbi:GH92 family glycosyl hydrolase [Planctomycetes bacterium CA13]